MGLLLGMAVAYYLPFQNKSKQTSSIESVQEKLALCEFQREEVTEKLKALDASAEGKSSDEILAEMMKIFIADWGLKLKFKSAEAKCEIPQVGLPAVIEESNNKSNPQSLSMGNAIATPYEPSSQINKEPIFFKKWENHVTAAREEEEALQAIEKIKVQDLFQIYSNTTEVGMKDIRFLEGKFIGGIKPQNSKDKPIDLELQLEIQKRTHPPEGIFVLLEFINGKQTSRSSGRGKFKGISKYQDSKAIYIDRAGGDNVMHLYYVPALDSLVGNDYVKSGKSKLEYNGQIILRKAN